MRVVYECMHIRTYVPTSVYEWMYVCMYDQSRSSENDERAFEIVREREVRERCRFETCFSDGLSPSLLHRSFSNSCLLSMISRCFEADSALIEFLPQEFVAPVLCIHMSPSNDLILCRV